MMTGESVSLAQALHATPDDLECARRLYAGTMDARHAAPLFEYASKIRDECVGRHFVSAGVVSPITACTVTPACTYCPLTPGLLLDESRTMQAFPVLARRGVQSVYLNGGTRMEGYDAAALALVDAAVGAGLAPILNFGPSFSRTGLRELQRAGAAAIVASTEAFSPALFARLKPGDVLEARQRLQDDCEEEGIPFESIALVGVGESIDDHLEHLSYLRRYRYLRRVAFSRFRPAAGTPLGNRARCSPWTVARLVAIARLMLPGCEIGLNMGMEADELPLWFAAGGGGGRIHAVAVTPRDEAHVPVAEGEQQRLSNHCVLIDRRPLLQAALAEFGASLDGAVCRELRRSAVSYGGH